MRARVTLASENRTDADAVAIPSQTERAIAVGLVQSVGNAFGRAAAWAVETALQFGALVSALMGPAIVCAYAFALWSLAGNLGWTDSFVFATGPFSNWLLWLGFALLVNFAASILKRHTRVED